MNGTALWLLGISQPRGMWRTGLKVGIWLNFTVEWETCWGLHCLQIHDVKADLEQHPFRKISINYKSRDQPHHYNLLTSRALILSVSLLIKHDYRNLCECIYAQNIIFCLRSLLQSPVCESVRSRFFIYTQSMSRTSGSY